MKRLLFLLLFANLAFFAYTRLVRDAGETPAADAAPAVPRLLLASEAQQLPVRCVSVGPFTSEAGAMKARDLAGGRARVRSLESPGTTAYWVMLPAKTLQDATRIVLRLRAGGVTDLEPMPPDAAGGNAAVSLGLFTERDRAERRASSLVKYAVAPEIVEQRHATTSYWLDAYLPPGAPAPDRTALARAAGEGAALESVDCPATPAPAAPAAPPPAAPAPGAAPAVPAPANPSAPPAADAKIPGTPA
jgi:hypothetical protein